MRCDDHGPFEGDVCPQPGCTALFRPYVAEQPESCDAPGCGMARPCRLHPDAAVRAEFVAHRAVWQGIAPPVPGPGAAPCGGRVQLRFPWGPVALPESGLLTIGRDFGAECGCEIEDFDNVSRLHATIRAHEDGAVVQDRASTNGTTINGQPIKAYADQLLHDGDIVGFGADLRAVVEMGEGGR